MPTSFDAFLEDVLQSFTINSLTAASFSCLLHAGPGHIPQSYAVLSALLCLAALLLTRATERDAD